MRSEVYIFIGVVVGAGIGSVGTYFGLKRRLERKHDEELRSEIESLKAHYEEKYEKKTSKTEEELKKELYHDVKKRLEEAKYIKINEENPKKITKYSSFYSDDGVHFKNLDPGGPTEGDDTELEEEEDLVSVDSSINYMAKELYQRGIEVISEDEFIERDGYEAKDCFYYVRSETLVDENDDILDGFVDYVGHEWLNFVENKPGSVVYVKNNRTSVKYMITAVEGDYIYE